jgi:hypothetical protein
MEVQLRLPPGVATIDVSGRTSAEYERNEEHGMIAAVMGWIGTFGTIGAYVMLSRGSWNSTSLRYAALNGVGGMLGACASAAYGAWPSVASNLVWSAVALHSAVVTLQARRGRQLASVHQLPVSPTDPDPQPLLLRAA